MAELAPKVGTAKNPAPIEEWERAEGPVELPVKQLERFAERTRAPFGMLFLAEPPTEKLPVQDFRRPTANGARKPSLNLLDTLLETELRQSWLSEQLEADGEEPLTFIGSATLNSDIRSLAAEIRTTLRIATADRAKSRNNFEAVLWMIGRLEESRITVVRKGFAGSATRRSLDPTEFKGFALADPFAPFVFLNGKDWVGSQMFTIAHELVHLWLGISAMPSGEWFAPSDEPVEQFCNQVAAELLMPENEVRPLWQADRSALENCETVARHFRVSSLAMLFRARNIGLITERDMQSTQTDLRRAFESAETESKSRGGNFYNNAGVHLGKRFIREVLARTLEGRTQYGEAFDLLGTR
ncbi:MAG: ImmA/IrrE family metallo-endopeptidase [Fimbriimonadaceae bacterium]|nr:ImmA/IrrE family metallo-endopeptidase [Fimbriimonadaceae bacterium]